MNRGREIIQSASFGYAYHTIICDDEGNPSDFKVVDCNPAFEKMAGLQASEITGKTIYDVLPALHESNFDWTSICKEILLNGGKKEFEHYFDSLEKWYQVQAYSVENNHVVTIFTDITSYKQAERQKQIFASIIEQSPFYVFITDLDGNIEYVNPAFTRITGYSFAEANGRNPRLLKSGKMKQEVYTGLWATITRGKIWRGEFINRRKNGEEYNEDAVISPLKDDDGNICKYFAIKEDITEEKAREKEALQSARILKATYNSLTDRFFLLDKNYAVLAFNKASADEIHLLWNKTLEKGDYIKQYFEPADWETFKTNVDTAFSGIKPENEREIKYPGGNTYWYKCKYFPVYDEHNHIFGVSVTITDITQSKRAEEDLRKSENRYKSLFEQSNDPIILHDLEGNIFNFNQRAKELAKTSGNQVNYSVFEFPMKEEAGKVRRAFTEVKKNGSVRFETKVKTARGNIIDIDVSSRIVDKKNGIFQAIIRDITKRKQSEEELRKREEKYEALFEYSNDAIIMHDFQGKIINTNQKVTELYGYSKTQILHTNLFSLHPKTELPKIKIASDEVRKNGFYRFETKIITANGEIIDVDVSATVVDRDNEIIQGMIRDISEHKRIEQELKHAKDQAESANKAKSEFLANMSHEIRTPLNAIMGFSDILANQLESKNLANYAASIQKSGKNLLEIINDILDLSKIEAGRLNLNRDYFNVNEFAEYIRQIYSERAYETDIGLEIEVDPNMPALIESDELRLRQIISNLVSNALKFTETGKVSVNFIAERKDSNKQEADIAVYVVDTGIGIAKEKQKVIFDPFRQEDKVTTKTQGGTGLGLAITKRLVNMLNGEISLKSEVNEGTEFTVRFKGVRFHEQSKEMRDGEANVIAEGETGEYNAGLAETDILLVEDDLTNREVILVFLEEQPVKVHEAVTGEEAVAFCKKQRPAVVLMDIRIPVIDGYEATRQIRNIYPDIPVIAITASTMGTEESQANFAQFDDYLLKPISGDKLFRSLAKFISRNEGAGAKTQKASDTYTIDWNKIQNPGKLAEKIDSEYQGLLEKAKNSGNFEEAKNFSEKVIPLGNEHNMVVLNKIGEDLYNASEACDIEEMKSNFKEIEKVFDEIKKQNKKEGD